MEGRMDGRENSIPTHKHSLRGYNYDLPESTIEISPLVPEKKNFMGVYHKWTVKQNSIFESLSKFVKILVLCILYENR